MAKLVFLQSSSYSYLGPMYISALLKARGHQCEMLVDEEERDLMGALAAARPDAVGFSCMTGQHLWALETAARVQALFGGHVPVVFGGPHPTYFPEVVEHPAVNIVCVGEGEHATLELMDAIDKRADFSHIANLWVKRGGEGAGAAKATGAATATGGAKAGGAAGPSGAIARNDVRPLVADLDELPVPDRVLYAAYPFVRDDPDKPFIASRGCPYNCSFCYNKSYKMLYRGKGHVVRRVSVGRLINEMKSVRDHFPVQSVRFYDDTLTANEDWLVEFCDKYRREIGLPFSGNIRANEINARMAEALKAAGCRSIYFGIESGNDRIREEILNKKLTRDQIVAAARTLHEAGLIFGTFNILGHPGETVDQAFETVDLNVQIGTDLPWCSLMQPYPKTEIEAYAKEIGVLEDGYEERVYRSNFSRSVLKQPGIHELENLHKLFYLAVRAPATRPAIRWLIKLPYNPLFVLVFFLCYLRRYMRSYGVSLLRGVMLGVKFRRNF